METMSNGSPASPRRIPLQYLLLAVVIFVLAPFLSWYGTWFGRPLTDSQIGEYLRDPKARKVQHALWKVAERIQNGDSTVRQWYPKICALAGSSIPEIRINVAWVMGQDNRAEEFHRALLPMLEDRDPLVRHNAALALVRFQDASGRPELVDMLRPFAVRAPREGTLTFRLKVEDTVGRGTLLARIAAGEAEPVEVRSPLPGRFQGMLVKDGAHVKAGDQLLTLAPGVEQVWESLRALYLVGAAEDLPDVERFTRGSSDLPPSVRQQAELTAQAIRKRA